jgi:exodeoxyribonuclease VII small subunit
MVLENSMQASIPAGSNGETILEALSYEQAYLELEEIVSALESDKNTLDEALALFERGQRLARHCAGLLDKAELKIMQLSGDELIDYPNQV